MHKVYFVKYDDTVDAVSDTLRRSGGSGGIITEEVVDTVTYVGGNHGLEFENY